MNMVVPSSMNNTCFPCCSQNLNFEILCLDNVRKQDLWLAGKFQKAFVGR